LGDGSAAGGTAEDRFFGAINAGGIQSFQISMGNSTDWEVDHLQFGLAAVPEPSTWLLAMAGVIGMCLRRKLRGHGVPMLIAKLQTSHISVVSFCVLVTMLALTPAGMAAPVTYSNPADLYGTVVNTSCGIGGICAAAEAINSFIFLNNFYSGIYNSTGITVGNHATPAQAAVEFGVGTGAGGDICGYYSRFGAAPCAPNNGVNQNYVDTKSTWVNKYAPNTTTVSQQTNGNQGFNLLTMFIGPELQAHEDVELFIYQADANGNPTTSGHVIAPTSITYDPTNPNGAISLTYQDPNFPTNSYTATASVNGAGYLSFFDAPTFGANAVVTAAFAESPLAALIPEPGTWTLIMAPMTGLLIVRRRKSRALLYRSTAITS